MDQYLYPATAEIDGKILATATAFAPCRAIISGTLHGPEICELWTPEKLASIGIKRIVAAELPVDSTGWPFLPGAPVDVETDTEIHRSYPNAVPDVEGSSANQMRLASALRAERNARLAACDWTQIPDAALSPTDKAEWAVYRQGLRDITTQESFPASVAWPVAPEGGL